jgi:uroporphyrinogen-III synthase
VKLLIIRPLPSATITAQRSIKQGFTPIVMPLFAVLPVAWAVPDIQDYDALLITSANAIRHGGAGLDTLHTLPVFAVGGATAQAAQAAGFSVAATGNSNGNQILQTAFEQGARKILWISGADTAPLRPSAFMRLDRVIVYQSAPLPAPPNFADTLAMPDVIAALHSPRSARHFAAQCALHSVTHVAVSLAVLSPMVAHAAGTGWRHVATAAMPNDIALLQAAKSYFTNLPRGPYC